MVLTKTVMRLDLNGCYKCKKVALHSVTKMEGIESLEINMKDSTLTVIGEVDSVCVANMLRRKFRCAQLVSAGPLPPDPPPKPKEEKKEEKKEERGPRKDVATNGSSDEPPRGPRKDVATNGSSDEPTKSETIEEKKEKKFEQKKEPPITVQQSPQWPHPMWYQECDAQCYPPCSTCSSRPEIMWPRYHRPGCPPSEVWYVWNEEKQDSCTVM